MNLPNFHKVREKYFEIFLKYPFYGAFLTQRELLTNCYVLGKIILGSLEKYVIFLICLPYAYPKKSGVFKKALTVAESVVGAAGFEPATR